MAKVFSFMNIRYMHLYLWHINRGKGILNRITIVGVCSRINDNSCYAIFICLLDSIDNLSFSVTCNVNYVTKILPRYAHGKPW